jgi:hypothetical protein
VNVLRRCEPELGLPWGPLSAEPPASTFGP